MDNEKLKKLEHDQYIAEKKLLQPSRGSVTDFISNSDCRDFTPATLETKMEYPLPTDGITEQIFIRLSAFFAQNRYLELAGSDVRVDLHPYERQGLDIIPTVHMGSAVTQMERRGIATNIGDLNRDIRTANHLLAAIRNTINGLREWTAEIRQAQKEAAAEMGTCRAGRCGAFGHKAKKQLFFYGKTLIMIPRPQGSLA